MQEKLIEQRDYRNKLKELSVSQLHKESQKYTCTGWQRMYVRWELLDRKENNEK